MLDIGDVQRRAAPARYAGEIYRVAGVRIDASGYVAQFNALREL